MVGCGPEFDGSGDNAGADVVHRQRDSDTARGPDEDRARRQDERLFRETGHFAGVFQTLPACAGVGIAGIDDDCLGPALGHALEADFDRRGTGLIGGEHAGDRGGDFGHNQRQVALISFVRAFAGAEALDITKDTRGAKAPRGNNGTWDCSQFSFHSSSQNSSGAYEFELFPPLSIRQVPEPQCMFTTIPLSQESRTSGSYFAPLGRWHL